jgi:hypothetical protein
MSAGTGEFFAIDRRVWTKVCELSLNQAVTYVVLACFTRRDNRTTGASVHAVETYTSISRARARKAIDELVANGLIRRMRGAPLPEYNLVPAAELPSVVTRPPEPKRLKRELQSDFEARCAEWADHVRAIEKPDPIWLPNSLVRGAAGETPPIERVRQTQDVMTLRLLVDLYYAQDLREEGGVNRQLMWRKYERVPVGQRGQFRVWGFRHTSDFVGWGSTVTRCHRRDTLTREERAEGKNAAVDFFRRQQQLVGAGLVEWIPTLFESDNAEAEALHPYGMGDSEGLEDRLGHAGHAAGGALLTPGQQEWASEQGLWLVPVPQHIAHVQMIGIGRLRYRPRTRKTAAWRAELHTKGEQILERYLAIASGEDTARAQTG